MQLTHRFTVPASVEETWAAFNDIESVAGCFPGAQVSSVEGDTFQGSCKVKLGPIALVYNGSGTIAEKDESAHKMVINAKGKDKRGNGTAGADVVATLSEGADGTDVEVITDLAVTGKPAQFGRGVIQDVSDKLLGQFVGCLEQKLTGPDDPDAEPGKVPSAADVAEGPGADQDAGPDSRPSGASAGSPARAGVRATPPADDALDLGAAVIPVLVKTYGKQIAAVMGILAVLAWLRGRRSR